MFMQQVETGVSVRALLKSAYEILSKRNPHRDIILPKSALTEIADGSDDHKTSTGFMGYDSTKLFQFNGKIWVVARGETCGGYPKDSYDSDILAVEFPDKTPPLKISKDLTQRIRDSSYFRNSLVFGMADGCLGFNDHGKFGMQVFNLLEPRLGEFVAQKAEYNTSVYLASTMEHPAKKRVLYKPEFANVLSDTLEIVLRKQ